MHTFSFKYALGWRLVSVALIPIVTSALLLIPLSESIKEEVAADNLMIARAVEGQIEQYLLQPQLLLEHFAETVNSRNNIEEKQQVLRDVMRNNRIFDALYIVSGNEHLEAVALPLHRSEFEDDYIGISLSNRSLLRKVEQSGIRSWSDTFLSIVTGRMSLALALPLNQSTLVGEFNIEQISLFLDRISIGDHILPIILDRHGRVIAHRAAELTARQINLSNIPLIKDSITGVSTSRDFEYEGKLYFGSTVPISSLDWFVLVAQPAEHAFQDISRSKYALLIASLAGLTVAGLFAFMMGRRLARPIEQLTQQTKRVAGGQYDMQFTGIEAIKELAELRFNFQKMAQSVHDRENQILRREAELKTLTETTGAIPWRMDLDHHQFTFIGHQVRELTGYPDYSWKKLKDWIDRIHPDDRDSIVLTRLNDSGSYVNHMVEYRLLTRDGKTVWVRDSAVVIHDQQTRLNSMVGFMIDITLYKNLELELRETLQELDNRVYERTFQLDSKIAELERTRDSLVQSEKMASLGRLVAGFAHELNTPVGVAVGASTHLGQKVKELYSILECDEVDEEYLQERLEQIKSASDLVFKNLKRASELVLSFKRTSIDQTRDTVRTFNLSQSVNDLINSLSGQLKRGFIEIETDIDNNLMVNSYPGIFDQILTNFITNSVSHAFDKSGGRITITARSDGNSGLEIVYSDNGKGINQEIMHKIFEPFFTTSRDSGGSGLGLYICYNLVTARLGGKIIVASSSQEGTRFTIHIPECVQV